MSCFTQFATYNNRDEATRAIKVENLWHKDRNRDTREGIKEVYKCKYSNRFNYADLAKWAINNRNIPIDDNEPFVIDDFIQIDDHHLSLIHI